MVWIWKLSSSLVFGNFSKMFKKFWILKNSLSFFHFLISILRHFHFTFHFSKRMNQIFISLSTSWKEWIRFSFHFSLLEKSETDFQFTFHFSNFQCPLSQDTAFHLTCFHNFKITPNVSNMSNICLFSFFDFFQS